MVSRLKVKIKIFPFAFKGEDAESDNEIPSTVGPRFGETGHPYPPYRPYPPEYHPPEMEDEFIVPEGAHAEMRCKMQSKNTFLLFIKLKYDC